MSVEVLNNVAYDRVLLEVGRKAVEDTLVELRNNSVSVQRNNGLCIREFDGTDSDIIRMSTEDALTTALVAIYKHLNTDFSK